MKRQPLSSFQVPVLQTGGLAHLAESLQGAGPARGGIRDVGALVPPSAGSWGLCVNNDHSQKSIHVRSGDENRLDR